MSNNFFDFSDTLNDIVNFPDVYDTYNFSDFTSEEKQFLNEVIFLLGEKVNGHHIFLEREIFDTINRDSLPLYFIRSSFEYTILLWVLVVDKFAKNDIPFKLGQAISSTIEYSFLYPNLFVDSGFDSFDSGIEKWMNLYDDILKSLYSNKDNYQKRIENLFCLIVDKPMTDTMDGQMGLFEEFEYLNTSDKYRYYILIKVSFENYIIDVLSSFPKEVNHIIKKFTY